jgi:SAM-dependent methyltransferase
MNTTPDGAGPATLQPRYFDEVYAAQPDPWGFETSPYEKEKYAQTLLALPRPRFDSGFEIGCSIGVLSALLAPRCDGLLAVDVSEVALAQARQRLRPWPHVQLRRMEVPAQFPEHSFDLVVMSEVGYYWNAHDLALASARTVHALVPQGVLLLVHWTPPVPDYPQTGDAVHEHFLGLCTPGGPLRHTAAHREPTYRIDVLERQASRARRVAISA